MASSATYTPFAFENKDKQGVDLDIDIIDVIARQQHLELRIVNTQFTSIFASIDDDGMNFVHLRRHDQR
ncbi:hypothetical protein PWP93_25170 [Paraburkholderia sp. A1RI-2L]|uniref:transporter substrate-binding domain-containing protein n=1 Tax=Paraburkholderia sp. A1RI-2L TaxID=3028367 RepID=UPI003B7676C9